MGVGAISRKEMNMFGTSKQFRTEQSDECMHDSLVESDPNHVAWSDVQRYREGRCSFETHGVDALPGDDLYADESCPVTVRSAGVWS